MNGKKKDASKGKEEYIDVDTKPAESSDEDDDNSWPVSDPILSGASDQLPSGASDPFWLILHVLTYVQVRKRNAVWRPVLERVGSN